MGGHAPRGLLFWILLIFVFRVASFNGDITPVLEVSEGDIFAHKTPGPLADASTQVYISLTGLRKIGS